MTRDRQSALALLVGSIAWIVTMSLHPTGGSFEKIARISSIIVGTHSLALATIPLMLFGFLGLTARLGADRGLPVAALITYAFGSVAAMCAAVINGLALPAFVEQFRESKLASPDAAHMVVAYGSTMNAGFARVFMAATAAAVLFWSISILTTRTLPRWIGALGVAAGLTGLFLVLSGTLSVHVHDFGLFVFGYAAWTILVGVLLWRRP
jgi:hypothetical protein